MLKLSIEEIIKRIEKGVAFEAEAKDNSFRIKINQYVPFICTAIHDGSRMRDELKLKSLHSDYERWYEEDPSTGDFISSMPIVLVGHDSRFEYDLNRARNKAVMDVAWGKKVWRKSLTKAEKDRSLKKHDNYYRVTHALVSKIESLFEGCVVYDIHSYNYKRWDKKVPLFNLGTERVDNEKFGEYVEHFRCELEKIDIPDLKSGAEVNGVFYGRGYNLEFITKNFDNTLVLATEVKKVYCNEESGESYPVIVKGIRDQLKTAIINNANFFAGKKSNWEHIKSSKLLSKNLESTILKIDRELFSLTKDFELLNFVNPININQEKKKFFNSKGMENPDFVYRPVEINPFELKRKLHRLEVEKISDINIQHLYESVINAYVDKVDVLGSIGTDKFLYNSLRYFGEPHKQDIQNAQFLLHLPDIEEEQSKEPLLGVDEAIKVFKESFDDYGFEGKIEVSKKMVAHAMVLNQKKKVVLKHDAQYRSKELNFLAHHEIGVHMVTTMNSNLQPLKVFNIGLPVNTLTQEGLAVLAEFLSGNTTLKRLKELGLRVIALEMLCNGADFKKTYRHLVNEYHMDIDEAFYLVTRAYRGGGFTKDYLYLRGFKEAYQFWKEGNDLSPLLIGKTSFEFYNTIVEMIDRGLLNKPKYITKPFENPRTDLNNPIFDYVIKGIK